MYFARLGKELHKRVEFNLKNHQTVLEQVQEINNEIKD